LGRRTALGTTALVIGANLPDVDVLSLLGGPLADLEWRRGWTHGVLAMMTLPLLLTGALLLLARIRIGSWRRVPPTVRPVQLLLLSSIAVLSHPMLDSLNTYGVRWLMPFSSRWFYGDVLFIVDPWLWLLLGGGLLWSWMRRRKGVAGVSAPVTWALGMALAYIGLMAISSIAARTLVARQIGQRFGGTTLTTMAGPLPLTPASRNFVVEQRDHYRVGTFHWLRRPHVDPAEVMSYPRRHPAEHPAYASADSLLAFRRFMSWARFPSLSLERTGAAQYMVHAVDLRYARAPGARFGSLSVPVTLSPRSSEKGQTGPPENIAYCIQNTRPRIR
jgi:inner membrane protein